MSFSFPSLQSKRLAWGVILVATLTSANSLPPKLAPLAGTPLTSDGKSLFCISATQGLLTQLFAGSPAWEALDVTQSFKRLSSIAYIKETDTLVLFDGDAQALYRYSLRHHQLESIRLSEDAKIPTDAVVAATSGAIFLGSVQAGPVFQVEGEPATLRPIPALSFEAGSGIAASGESPRSSPSLASGG